MALHPDEISAALLLAIVVMALPAAAIAPRGARRMTALRFDHFPTEPIWQFACEGDPLFHPFLLIRRRDVTVVGRRASGEVGGIGIVADDGLSVVEIPLNATAPMRCRRR